MKSIPAEKQRHRGFFKRRRHLNFWNIEGSEMLKSMMRTLQRPFLPYMYDELRMIESGLVCQCGEWAGRDMLER